MIAALVDILRAARSYNHLRVNDARPAVRPIVCALGLWLAVARSAVGAEWRSLPAHPNIAWAVGDSVSACPGGDSAAPGVPPRLRVALRYCGGAPCLPRCGVPPDSLLLRIAPLPASGTATVNDLPPGAGGWQLQADDSTDALGETRFTVPSLSGVGMLGLSLVVSGEPVASDVATIRSADGDLDGRVGGGEGQVDLDYSGGVDAADLALIAAHVGHWHREVLAGTLVQRTDLCGTCPPETEGTLGESGASWSPDGRRLAFTRFTGPLADCAVHIVASDPRDGNATVQFTFPPAGVHDYDPDWSPLGTEIAFDRGDSACYRKGVPGVNPDTALHLITRSDDGSPHHIGDISPSISTDGRWVAFSRKGAEGYWHLWKIPIEGMEAGRTPTQLTNTLYASDLYPRWSADGAWIYVDRENGYAGIRHVYRIPAAGGREDSLLAPPGLNATTPGPSPDGLVVALGIGGPTTSAPWAIEAALPAQSTLSAAIPAFPGYGLTEDHPLLLPRFSPDGTRIALRASPAGRPSELPQIWATRRAVSPPPVLQALAGLTLDPATPFADLDAPPGVPLVFALVASNPGGGPLTWSAYFLRVDIGMSFDPVTATFTWTPPESAADSVFTVRFQASTPSGGTAYALARLQVGIAHAGSPGLALGPAAPNPFADAVTIPFVLPAAADTRLEIFDLAGRRIEVVLDVRLAAGPHAARWVAGAHRPGVYLCRLEAGPWRAQRTLVLAR